MIATEVVAASDAETVANASLVPPAKEKVELKAQQCQGHYEPHGRRERASCTLLGDETEEATAAIRGLKAEYQEAHRLPRETFGAEEPFAIGKVQ